MCVYMQYLNQVKYLSPQTFIISKWWKHSNFFASFLKYINIALPMVILLWVAHQNFLLLLMYNNYSLISLFTLFYSHCLITIIGHWFHQFQFQWNQCKSEIMKFPVFLFISLNAMISTPIYVFTKGKIILFL